MTYRASVVRRPVARACSAAIVTVLLGAAVFAQSENPAKLPTLKDLAHVWVGATAPTGLEYFRLELNESGSGVLTVQYAPDTAAVAYRVTATKLSGHKITCDLKPLDRDAQPIRFRGTATSSQLELEAYSEALGWRRKIVFHPYERLARQLKAVTERAARIQQSPSSK